MEAKQIHLKDGKKEYFISIDNVLFVKAGGNYCDVYLTQHIIYKTIRIQIGQLWNLIEGVKPANNHTLARIGRSYIINLKYLQYTDPKKKVIKLYTDKAVELIVPREAIKSLLMLLSKDKRREVLRSEYFEEKVLTIPVEELNEEHQKSNGFEYVDLGLPSGTLWATENLNEGGLPEFFAWGELYPSEDYDWREYIHYDEEGKKPVRNPADPATSILLPEFDAARQARGGGWRLPTSEECEELARECILSWCKIDDRKSGMLVTGPNGNRIFLSANGIMEGTELKEYGETCCYWTSKGAKYGRAVVMRFYDGFQYIEGSDSFKNACCGLSIRPVISKEYVCEEDKTLKRMLVVGDFFATDDDALMPSPMIKLDGWIIKDISLPLEPKHAMGKLTDVCMSYNPDAIVGIRTSCIFVKRMSAYKRFLWEPHCKMTDALNSYMEYQLESEVKSDEWTVSDEMIQHYKKLEAQLSLQKIEGECWVIADIDNIDDNDNQYENCEFVEPVELKSTASWRSAYMFPLINEVVNGTYKDEMGKLTPYGKKFNLY